MQGLIDTRNEYIKILQDTISVPLSERIYEMYVLNNKKGKNVLQEFQKELQKIPHWNNHIIENETKLIVDKSRCQYVYKVVKLVIMTGIKIKFREYGQNVKDMNIKIPTVEDFIHKCFVNSATFCWKYSYLFSQSNMTTVQIQSNMNTIEHNIRKMVSKTIRQYINIPELIEELETLAENSFKKDRGCVNKKQEVKFNEVVKEHSYIEENKKEDSESAEENHSDIEECDEEGSETNDKEVSDEPQEHNSEDDTVNDCEKDTVNDTDCEEDTTGCGNNEDNEDNEEINDIVDNDTENNDDTDNDEEGVSSGDEIVCLNNLQRKENDIQFQSDEDNSSDDHEDEQYNEPVVVPNNEIRSVKIVHMKKNKNGFF